MGKILDDENIRHLEVDSIPLILKIICWKYQNYNLLALYLFLGKDKFGEFLDKFSGCYFKIPNPQKIMKVVDEFRLAHVYQRMMKAVKDKDVPNWQALEKIFNNECKRLGIKPVSAREGVYLYKKQIKAAEEWIEKLQMMEDRQNKAEM